MILLVSYCTRANKGQRLVVGLATMTSNYSNRVKLKQSHCGYLIIKISVSYFCFTKFLKLNMKSDELNVQLLCQFVGGNKELR